ncbi:MAG: hypothetical protein PHU42_01270 [Patescibacteria group bacterium]|nr:hypothetical protein [Patescibacteria group bacterium]
MANKKNIKLTKEQKGKISDQLSEILVNFLQSEEKNSNKNIKTTKHKAAELKSVFTEKCLSG